MVKKISAVLLALVLCLSVVVLPASAAGFAADYTLAGKEIAYKIELDKTSYKAGDTAVVSVYLFVDDTKEFGTGALVFGMNSAVFAQADNAANDVKAGSTGNATFTSFYKATTNATWAWQPATIVNNISAGNTAEENANYDEYLKIVIARNLSGTHANAGTNVNGLPGSEINADPDPFITFKLKVKADTTASEINIGIPSGSMPKNYTYMNWYSNPGSAATVTKTSAATTDTTYMATSATIGAAGPALAKSKAQVKMTPNSATTVEDAFSFRVTSKITDADWDTYFANSADSAATTNAIKAVGFVAYKGTAGFNLDTAKAVAQGTPAAGYDVATTDYIQKANDTSDAFFGCRVDITSAATRSDVTYVAFVQYLDATGNTAYAFYDAEQQALLNTNYDTIVSNYLVAYPFAG